MVGADTQLLFRETHDWLHYCSTYGPSLLDEFCVVMQWYSVDLRLLLFEFQKCLQLTTAQYNYGYPADVEEDDITWIDTLKTRMKTVTIQNELHFFNVFPFFNYDHARTVSNQIAGRYVVNTDPLAVRGLNDPILGRYSATDTDKHSRYKKRTKYPVQTIVFLKKNKRYLRKKCLDKNIQLLGRCCNNDKPLTPEVRLNERKSTKCGRAASFTFNDSTEELTFNDDRNVEWINYGNDG